MAKLQQKRIKPKDLLRNTWNKAFTKQWVQTNTPFKVPRSIVHSETWQGLTKWLRGPSCPINVTMVVKPVNLSLSRGVRIFSKEPKEDLYRDALGRTMDIVEFTTDIQSDLPSSSANYKWLVEEYVAPTPEKLLELTYDKDFNPLIRVVLKGGKFHIGEVKIPTRKSRGRGTLKGGARRVVINWEGKADAKYIPVNNDSIWNQTNYGTRIDLNGYELPHFSEICGNIETHIAKEMCPVGVFAVDGCYRKTPEGVEFVIIEIEHSPNVRHLLNTNIYKKPQ